MRNLSIHHIIAVTLLIASILTLSKHAEAADVVGRASVIDGDTLDIHGQRIRLHGIDAPESSQVCNRSDLTSYRCGKEAAFALDSFLAASRPTRCVELNRDRYRRIVGECFRADGVSVNAWMVRQGWAVDWVRYSKGAYSAEQTQAERALKGLWSGPFEMPCAHRAIKLGHNPSC